MAQNTTGIFRYVTHSVPLGMLVDKSFDSNASAVHRMAVISRQTPEMMETAQVVR